MKAWRTGSRATRSRKPEKAGTGRAIVNLLRLPKERQVVAILPVPDEDEAPESLQLFTATRRGRVKRTSFSQYKNVRAGGLRAVVIPEGDTLLAATLTSGGGQVVLTTRNGEGHSLPGERCPVHRTRVGRRDRHPPAGR